MQNFGDSPLPSDSLLQPSRSGAGGSFVTIDEPVLTQHHHPKSVAYLCFYFVTVLMNWNILFPFYSFILHLNFFLCFKC